MLPEKCLPALCGVNGQFSQWKRFTDCNRCLENGQSSHMSHPHHRHPRVLKLYFGHLWSWKHFSPSFTSTYLLSFDVPAGLWLCFGWVFFLVPHHWLGEVPPKSHVWRLVTLYSVHGLCRSRLSAHSIAFLSITIKFSILIRQLREHRQSILCPPPYAYCEPWMAFPAKVWCNSPYLAARPPGVRGDDEGSQLGDGNVWKPQPGDRIRTVLWGVFNFPRLCHLSRMVIIHRRPILEVTLAGSWERANEQVIISHC